MRGFRGLPLILLAACAAPEEGDERVAADRKDVTHALHRQFDEVVARRDALENEPGEEAARTRDELNSLAHEIAEHIVRLDPEADVDTLVQRLKVPQ
jgi:flagellar biosynthesis/type III secretory pathway protein FliH